MRLDEKSSKISVENTGAQKARRQRFKAVFLFSEQEERRPKVEFSGNNV
jgi:hypothetical protein